MNKKYVETSKFNNMIESFECDFNIAVERNKKTIELPLKGNERLLEDIKLWQELSFLLRHNKAKIIIENESEGE